MRIVDRSETSHASQYAKIGIHCTEIFNTPTVCLWPTIQYKTLKQYRYHQRNIDSTQTDDRYYKNRLQAVLQYSSLLNWRNIRFRCVSVAVLVNWNCVVISPYFVISKNVGIVRRLTRLQIMYNVLKYRNTWWNNENKSITGTAMEPQRNRIFRKFNNDQYCIIYFTKKYKQASTHCAYSRRV